MENEMEKGKRERAGFCPLDLCVFCEGEFLRVFPVTKITRMKKTMKALLFDALWNPTNCSVRLDFKTSLPVWTGFFLYLVCIQIFNN